MPLLPTTDDWSLQPGLRPLVILGAPRSGTKLLRTLLGQSPACAPIPYGLNHIWRLGLPPSSPDPRPASDATRKRTREIRSLLLDFAAPVPSTGYLIEKTCANTLRVPFVNRVLPDAQFVHIVRDGRDAAVSARKKWQRPPTLDYLLGKIQYVPFRNTDFLLWYLQNLWRGFWMADGTVQYWGPRYDSMQNDLREHSLLNVCARQWRSCVQSCLNTTSRLPEHRLISLRYEALVSDPTVLDRLLSRLDLADPDAVRDRYQSIVHARSVGRWRRDLSSEEQDAIDALLRPTLDRLHNLSTLSDQ